MADDKEAKPLTVPVKDGKIEVAYKCDTCGCRWEDWWPLGHREKPPKVKPHRVGRCEACALERAAPTLKKAYLETKKDA